MINTSVAVNLKVYCDMTTDGGAAYTMYPCIDCAAGATHTTDSNGCTALGMQTIIPRTRGHMESMASFLNKNLTTIVPGQSNFYTFMKGDSFVRDALTRG